MTLTSSAFLGPGLPISLSVFTAFGCSPIRAGELPLGRSPTQVERSQTWRTEPSKKNVPRYLETIYPHTRLGEKKRGEKQGDKWGGTNREYTYDVRSSAVPR